jgi:hypothetical protein
VERLQRLGLQGAAAVHELDLLVTGAKFEKGVMVERAEQSDQEAAA